MKTQPIHTPHAQRSEKLRARKAMRRQLEIGLLFLSLCLVFAAVVFHLPALMLASILPALASRSQR
jgi:hypothetical protein